MRKRTIESKCDLDILQVQEWCFDTACQISKFIMLLQLPGLLLRMHATSYTFARAQLESKLYKDE